jgi:hypothetical protein
MDSILKPLVPNFDGDGFVSVLRAKPSLHILATSNTPWVFAINSGRRRIDVTWKEIKRIPTDGVDLSYQWPGKYGYSAWNLACRTVKEISWAERYLQSVADVNQDFSLNFGML